MKWAFSTCLIVAVGVGDAALAPVVSSLVHLALYRLDVGGVVNGMLMRSDYRIIL